MGQKRMLDAVFDFASGQFGMPIWDSGQIWVKIGHFSVLWAIDWFSAFRAPLGLILGRVKVYGPFSALQGPIYR